MNFDFLSYTKKLISKKQLETHKKTKKYLLDYFQENKKELFWYNIKDYISKEKIQELTILANNLNKISDVVLILGIGGSINISKAIITALKPYFNNNKLIFIGDNLSSSYLLELKEYLKNKDFSLNVISKSGTTLETLITFSFLEDIMLEKYQKQELKKRIVFTTSQDNKDLITYLKKENYKILYIPKDIGGRYSSFTFVTLFPLALSNLNIKAYLKGAEKGKKYLNKALEYAIIRNIFFKKEKYVEGLVIYEKKLFNLTNWIKQVLAESEGKNNKGLLPINIIYPSDLHSLGQYIQEGKKLLFETVITINKTKTFLVKEYNKSLNHIIETIKKSVALAHLENDTPSLNIEIETLNEYYLGQLIMFFMLSASMSSYLFKVNPFDQPGVKKYKDLITKFLKET